MKVKILLLVISCSFFFVDHIQAQTPYFKQVNFSLDNTNNGVNSMCIDKNRFLWLATSDGLLKYNGRRSTDYYLNSADSIQDASAVFEDSRQTLWAGYSNGSIAVLQDSILRLAKLSGPMPNSSITSISEDREGRVWMTTAGDGIFYIIRNNIYTINSFNGLSDDYAYSITEDRLGRLWVGTDQGISICSVTPQGVQVLKIDESNGLPEEIIRDVKQDESGNIWVGMQEKGVCKINSASMKITIPEWSQNWSKGQVNDLLISDKDIWIATQDEGLLNAPLNSGNYIQNYKTSGSLNFSQINFLLTDAENNLWLAGKKGLVQSHGNWLLFLNEINHEKINYVHAICSGSGNNLFFTPDQGLIVFSPGSPKYNYKKFSIIEPGKLYDIASLYKDECGYIWIGTMGDGLYRLNPVNGIKQKFHQSELDKTSILGITPHNKELWLATLGGVIKCILPNECNTDRIVIRSQKLDTVPELGNYYIYTVFTDSKKRIWFGTDKKGITLLDKGKFYNYNMNNGLNGNVVYSITEDKKGNIWFSVAGEGVCRFDGHSFRNYTGSDGLRELTVTSIRAIGSDRILMVHRKGIDVLHSESGKIDFYGAEDNLDDINPDLNAIAVDNDEKVWIGTEKGIVIFNPLLNPNPAGPKIILQRVSLFDLKRNFINKTEFSHNQNYLAFDFTGLWYTDPGRVKYQYLLENYNKDWLNTSDNRIIYPNLPPGKYKFRVRTSLNRVFLSSDETSYSFTIDKPFWSKNWFRASLILFVFSIGGLYIKRHDRRIKRIEALKKESVEYRFETLKSQVNPHFLFNSFNTLIGIIEKDKITAVEYVEKLSDYFRNMIQHREKETILLGDEITMVNTYYYLQKKRFGNYLELEVRIPADVLLKYNVPPLSLQLLIENAVKHNMISKETPLKVEIFESGDKTVTVKNNINIKLNKEVSTGIGLANIISRYNILTQRKVLVFSDHSFFSVTVPLIS